MSGQQSYLAGKAAEECVARCYERGGHRIVARRWRGQAGEIDLIAEKQGAFVFVEVKSARNHTRAIQALGHRQQQRIVRAAEEFVGTQPKGLLSNMRVDVALMDRAGTVKILENAVMAA